MSPFELKVPFYIENKCFLCFKRDFTIASMTHIDFFKKKTKQTTKRNQPNKKNPKKHLSVIPKKNFRAVVFPHFK